MAARFVASAVQPVSSLPSSRRPSRSCRSDAGLSDDEPVEDESDLVSAGFDSDADLDSDVGAFLVPVAAIVRLIEARAFEDDAGAGAEQAFQLLLAAGGAFDEQFIVDALKHLEFVIAGAALIVVSRHELRLREWLRVR